MSETWFIPLYEGLYKGKPYEPYPSIVRKLFTCLLALKSLNIMPNYHNY